MIEGLMIDSMVGQPWAQIDPLHAQQVPVFRLHHVLLAWIAALHNDLGDILVQVRIVDGLGCRRIDTRANDHNNR